VLAKLARHGIEPQWMELEITETALLDQEGRAIEHLQRLRDAGMNISLDDFGKGYAGFAHLQSLPLTKLKIDRTLIAPLSNSPDDSPIVSSTIILAKRLGLVVVAEGVETREQVVCLKLAGCDIAQGYHFSRPLSVPQLREYPPFANAALKDEREKTCVP
jgi:EAL domain-containing protein (putative c-di-GMP-specific phosphodiesterase class I)